MVGCEIASVLTHGHSFSRMIPATLSQSTYETVVAFMSVRKIKRDYKEEIDKLTYGFERFAINHELGFTLVPFGRTNSGFIYASWELQSRPVLPRLGKEWFGSVKWKHRDLARIIWVWSKETFAYCCCWFRRSIITPMTPNEGNSRTPWMEAFPSSALNVINCIFKLRNQKRW